MNLQTKSKSYKRWIIKNVILFYEFIKNLIKKIWIYLSEKEQKLMDFVKKYNENYFTLCAFIFIFTIFIHSWDSFIYASLELMFGFFISSWIMKIYLSLSLEYSLRVMVYGLLILVTLPIVFTFKFGKFSITYITQLIYGKN